MEPGNKTGLLSASCDLGSSVYSAFKGAVGGEEKVSRSQWQRGRCFVKQVVPGKRRREQKASVSHCPFFL